MDKKTISQLAKKHNVSEEFVLDALKNAVQEVYNKEFPNSQVTIEFKDGDVFVKRGFVVVSDELEYYDTDFQISLEEALEIDKSAKVGEVVKNVVNLEKVSKTFQKNIIDSWTRTIKNESNKTLIQDYVGLKGIIIKKEYERMEKGRYLIKINDEVYGIMKKEDSLYGENLKPGQNYFFYVKDVSTKQTGDWPIILSRNDDILLKELIKINVVEYFNGDIEIMEIIRIPGARCKLILRSKKDGVDPIGSFIGPRGSRINAIKNELNNESIDLVKYSDNKKEFITNLCNPVKITGYIENSESIAIICPEKTKDHDGKERSNIALLIGGKNAYNIRLISRALGKKTEIVTIDKVSEYLKTNGGQVITIDPSLSFNNSERNNKGRPIEKATSLFDEFNDIEE